MIKNIHKGAVKITIILMIIGVIWNLLFDQLAFLFFEDLKNSSTFQTYKDWVFIGFTALIIFFLINNKIGQKNNLISSIYAESEWQKKLILNLPDTNVFLLNSKYKLRFHASDKSYENLHALLSIKLKESDNYCVNGSKPITVLNWLTKILKGENLQLAVNNGQELREIHGVPIRNNKNSVNNILLISFNRTQQRNLAKQFLNEKQSYAKLSEKYHTLNSELADSYNQLKTYNFELLENKERYSAFIQQTSEAVYRFDLKNPPDLSSPKKMQVDAINNSGYLAEYNTSFTQMHNLNSETNCIGKTIYDILSKKNHPNYLELITKLVKYNYTLKDFESVEYDSKGQTRYFINNIVGIVEDNKLIRYWGTKLEITRQKRYERELILSKRTAEQSDKLKTAFLANMSHEIRTPLNGILGFSELLCKKQLSDKQRTKYFNVIQTSNQQLLRIINDILDISRIQTGQLPISKTEFPLNTLIHEIEIFLKQKIKNNNSSVQLLVNKAFKNKEDVIYTDRERLYQIITNLVNNALKFTHKGSVTIEYKALDKTIIEFRVIDTGIGISKEYLDSIFTQFRQVEDFTSRKYGGAGLGLSISRGLVDLLGGSISVESEKNKGSIFKFTIKCR